MPTCTVSTSHSRPATELSVAELLLRVREGDSAAWEEIVHRYAGVVCTTVRSFRLQDADTLDAVQMTWLRLVENVHRVQHPEGLAGWLATTARRECLHILRQHAKHTPAATEALVENVVDPGTGPEQRAIDQDTARTRGMIWKFVDELSPLQRTLLRALFTEHSRSYAEIAHTVGIPTGGIGPTRARALHQLRSRLHDHGLGPGFWL